MDRGIEERIYAGVLGKILGVYHGRPVEGWSYERIRDRFGEVGYFVNDQLGLPITAPYTDGRDDAAPAPRPWAMVDA